MIISSKKERNDIDLVIDDIKKLLAFYGKGLARGNQVELFSRIIKEPDKTLEELSRTKSKNNNYIPINNDKSDDKFHYYTQDRRNLSVQIFKKLNFVYGSTIDSRLNNIILNKDSIKLNPSEKEYKEGKRSPHQIRDNILSMYENSLCYRWKNYIELRCDCQYILGIADKQSFKKPAPAESPYSYYYIQPSIYSEQCVEPIDTEELKNKYILSSTDNHRKRIQIYGRSGVGKTSLLKYLIINHLLPKSDSDKFPLFISARRVKSYYINSSLPNNVLKIYKEIIEEESKVTTEEIREKLEQGEVIVFVDGLDYSDSVDKKIVTLFIEFTEEFPENIFVFTSIKKNIIDEREIGSISIRH